MTSAKITRCKHYFHGVCLRKWLYVQDRCPLCHEIIMNQDPSPEKSDNDIDNNTPNVVNQELVVSPEPYNDNHWNVIL